MPEPVEPFASWFQRFQEEYERRTASTWQDNGWDLEPILECHAAGVTPREAVLEQIATLGPLEVPDSPRQAATESPPTPLEAPPIG